MSGKPMAKKQDTRQPLTNNEIRSVMLRYFYDRTQMPRAVGAEVVLAKSVKISDVKRELKLSHGLVQQEVQSNLTYLISQGWVKKKTQSKSRLPHLAAQSSPQPHISTQ